MNKMVGNWEIDQRPIPEQFLAFSEAYLDSAYRLCKVLKISTRKRTYPRGAVVLFLTFHAVELFLKAAILHKSPREGMHHDVVHLMNRYKALYPGKKYNLEVPFKAPVYIGFEPSKINPVKIPQDQLNRYPTNKDSEVWEGAIGFEPESFLLVIERLQSEMDHISELIFG